MCLPFEYAGPVGVSGMLSSFTSFTEMSFRNGGVVGAVPVRINRNIGDV